jgi:hypothetical protein
LWCFFCFLLLNLIHCSKNTSQAYSKAYISLESCSYKNNNKCMYKYTLIRFIQKWPHRNILNIFLMLS